MRFKCVPKFRTREIINSTITKDWDYFQEKAINLGKKLHKDMRGYINTHRQRDGGTGHLAKTINFDKKAGAVLDRIWWGIGNLDKLNAEAKYWYVINNGKKTDGSEFIPGGGKFVPGFFGSGNLPDANQKGKGKESFTKTKGKGLKIGIRPGVIRPMNYIEYTSAKLDKEIHKLLQSLKRRLK